MTAVLAPAVCSANLLVRTAGPYQRLAAGALEGVPASAIVTRMRKN